MTIHVTNLEFTNTMQSLKSIILSVIQEMNESHLRTQLLCHLTGQHDTFVKIENCFIRLTSKPQKKINLQYFFHSWSQTNNSAMTVAGIGNRLTMLVHKNQPIDDEHALL